ncbi:hypothetical protein HT749_31965 [Burkholderia cepacia]|uniref:hypothetical protein n=1 Tax=Burkholderia cepacia complex TaxID=87882 RepID=UPI00157B7930|nr:MULTISPECIES: hypothetical protein [Burkholderia cepacia complex]MBR8218296.1 hypothetical protein [Burkholderia vietnamiensis]NTX48008.1 hypothetical protein [Burkholderia cepacia]
MTRKDPTPIPIDPAVASAVATFDDATREWFQERAAIREFDGGLLRVEAERLALEDTRRWLDTRNQAADRQKDRA